MVTRKIPTATGHHALIQNRGPRGLVFVRGVENRGPRGPVFVRGADIRRPLRLLDMVIGRFARDDHIVHVTLAQPGAGDAHKLRLLLQLRNRAAPQVAHP